MGHQSGNGAARAVKNSERAKIAETRTPEQRMADIRKNRASKLFITPDDQDFLLERYYAAVQYAVDRDFAFGSLGLEKERLHDLLIQQTSIVQSGADAMEILGKENAELRAEIKTLEAKIEEFRQVYEEENRSMALKMERVEPAYGTGPDGIGTPDMP